MTTKLPRPHHPVIFIEADTSVSSDLSRLELGRPTLRAVLIALGVALAAFVLTHLLEVPGSVQHLHTATGGQPILDLVPAFTADAVYERLSAFGEVGRALYRRMVISVDIVFPVSVFAFLFLLSRYASQGVRLPPAMRLLLLSAPFGFFIPDLVENVAIFVLLSEFPQRHDVIAGLLGYLTVLKRVSFYAAVALPLGSLLIVWLRRKQR